MKLIRNSPGFYVTEDGRYEVSRDDNYETECDDPHPVRMRRDSISRYSEWYQRSLLSQNRSRDPRYITYLCPGNEAHWYSRWIVWDNETDDYVPPGSPHGYDTLAEARDAALAEYPPSS